MAYPQHIHLRVVIFPESVGKEIAWLAWCVERDIMSQGDTPAEAQAKLHRYFGVELTLSSPDTLSPPFMQIPQSPPEALARWTAAGEETTEIFWISGVTFTLTVRVAR